MNNLAERMRKICYNLSQKYNKATDDREDQTTLNFLKNKIGGTNIPYIEIGSGLGRFVDIVKSLNKFDISCLEINPDLAQKMSTLGYKTINTNILDNNLPSEQYQIVHCSHVIEHIAYPKIIKALDELIRITKKGGYIIIRSPLMSPDFFTSIDHIRPYPPKCILDFYSNPQQQITGKASIKIIKVKFRRQALLPFPYSNNVVALSLNLIMKLLWTYFRFPFAKPNGYTLIMQKN